MIFAAGNDGDLFGDVSEYPASYEAVVSVAAMGSDFLPAYYTCYNDEVDITAPGGDLYNSSLGTDNGGVRRWLVPMCRALRRWDSPIFRSWATA